MLGKLGVCFVVFAVSCLAGCDKTPWNDPYPETNEREKIYYTTFVEKPKHLDPAISYSAEEGVITYQIYEPPLQYHYLKRPYELIPLTATEMPVVEYLGPTGERLTEDHKEVAYTLYTVKIQPGILYQRHPAFVKKEASEAYLYHALDKKTIDGMHTILDFPSQSTRELTAEDFVYEIKRLADPHVNSPIFGVMKDYIIGLKELHETLKKAREKSGFLDLREYTLEGVEAVSRYVYTIKLKGKYIQFLNWLATPFFAPLPWEADKFYAQSVLVEKDISLDTYPVGTGPFFLAVNNPHFQMVLEKNPLFHGEKYPSSGERQDKEAGLLEAAGKSLPFLEKVVFVLEKEEIPYWNKFMQGYYDQSGVSANNFDTALQTIGSGNLALSDAFSEKAMALSSSPLPTIFYWGVNMLDETVGGYSEKQKKLRQALSIALDMEEYISIFLNGIGLAAHTPLPPGIFGYSSGIEGVNPFVYDINQKHNTFSRKSIAVAKQLLKEAGYENGIDPRTNRPLILYYDTIISGSASSSAMLSWMRKQFKKLGIELVIRGTQYSRFQDKMRSGNFQIYSWGWSADYPDPENILFLLYSKNGMVKYRGENVSNYSNARVDVLFDKMKNRENDPIRKQMIEEIVQRLQADAPWIGGYYPTAYVLRQPWVGPLKPNPIARNTMKYIFIDPEKRLELRKAWNPPIAWPLAVFMGMVFILFLPAIFLFWKKSYFSLVLKQKRKLKE